jgi:hypothetical protein
MAIILRDLDVIEISMKQIWLSAITYNVVGVSSNMSGDALSWIAIASCRQPEFLRNYFFRVRLFAPPLLNSFNVFLCNDGEQFNLVNFVPLQFLCFLPLPPSSIILQILKF